MKKITAIIGLASVMALALFTPSTAPAVSYITPTASYIDGSTNTVIVGTTTNQVNVVAAATTNNFNLSITPKSQANTNLWPALPMFPSINLNPFDKMTLFHQYTLMASNGANQTFRYAGTADGTYWVSNVCVVVFNTNGAYASGLNVSTLVNTNTHATPFWALQAIENPGPAPMTNNIFNPSAKPGF